LTPICTKSFVGWGFAQIPLGILQRSPRPQGGEERREERGGERTGGRREEGDRRGVKRRRGEAGSSSFALGKKRKVGAYGWR